MILCTFYFLFKRTNDRDFQVWHNSARTLVIMIFLCTATALVSLITMSNWLFDFYLLPSGYNICNNGTTVYVTPGIIISFMTFLIGFAYVC